MASGATGLTYLDAILQYRREHLSNVEATFLNTRIPFQLFATFYPASNLKNTARNEALLKELIKAAQLRYRATMRYAFCFEKFRWSPDIHTHVAIASDVALDLEFFRSYFPATRVNCEVLPYDEALSYMMKQTNIQLVNCDVYLKEAKTTRDRRRLRRMLRTQ